MHWNSNAIAILLLIASAVQGQTPQINLPLRVGEFDQQIHRPYTTAQGLPSNNVEQVELFEDGTLLAITDKGNARYDPDQDRFVDTKSAAPFSDPLTDGALLARLETLTGGQVEILSTAEHKGELAVAAASGLYLRKDEGWEMALPQQGIIRWAPIDVRAVGYDADGGLWFAAPQGVGYRNREGKWELFTGAEGLPYNDFTCLATGSKGVWFGTTNGAIHYHDGNFAFRQGGRWLLDNHVRDIAIDREGDAWIATVGGVSRIHLLPMTLAKKAAFYEEEIEKHHRRTRFGYVNPADLEVPGDKSTAVPTYSDNDGFNTGLYLSAMSLAYTVTGDEKYRQDAHKSFRALAFLSEVTQGGEYGGPEGLIARNVIPTTEPDPGEIYSEDYDIKRNRRDKLWKVLERRVPIDQTGEWYWKADASSDELDGHFLGSAIYFDQVCQTEEEREQVRRVVRRIIDHLIVHNYNLVDYDGQPTRWGHFSPEDLNRNPAWVEERGLNCYSILTYLSIAHHITGDPKYREAYLELAFDEGYGMNGMSQPKSIQGPDSTGHQPDDNMAFMNYYHLIRYETDPTLLSMYYYAIQTHWRYEKSEKNSFINFVYAACCRGKTRTDQWGEEDLSPPMYCYEDAVETLQLYPLDLLEWPTSNAHRIDMIPYGDPEEGPPKSGRRVDGRLFNIDERQEIYWDWDPYNLTREGDGTRLRPGFHYLLAYYLGRYHGFVEG